MSTPEGMSARRAGCVVALGLGVLAAGFLLTGLCRVREASARAQCTNNLKQLGIALDNHAAAHWRLPSASLPNPALPPERRLSWLVAILPYVEHDLEFRQFDLTAAADDPRNAAATAHRIRVYVCPASGEHVPNDGIWKSPGPIGHYVGIAGVGPDAATLPNEHRRAGAFGHDRKRRLHGVDFPDGLAHTAVIAETGSTPGHWAFGGSSTVRAFDPATAPYVGVGRPFGGFHESEEDWFTPNRHFVLVVMADGSVRTIADAVAPGVLEALATAAGGEPPPSDW